MKKHYILVMLSFLTVLFSYAQTPVITSVVDACGSDGKFVEIYVSGTLDFADYKLVRRSNANDWSSGTDVDISALGVRTDEFVYVGRDIPTMTAEFPSAGISASNAIENSNISHNGDDSYRLIEIAGDVVIDQFGGDIDGTGEPWEYVDTWVARNNGEGPNPTFTISEWTFGTLNDLDAVGLCNDPTNSTLETVASAVGTYMPPAPASGPTVSAPVPTEDPANVVSIYSDTYTDLTIANYDPDWGQPGNTLVNTTFDPTGSGTDFVLAYPNFTYQGTDFGSNEDLSGMDFLHVDIWVEAGTDRMVKVSPINNGSGAGEFLVEVPVTPGSWNSVTLDKADFTGMTWDSVFQLKFDGQFNADGTANTTPFDIYVDNIYFSQEATTTSAIFSGPFNVAADDDPPFTLNVNDAANSAGFSPLLYDSFEVTVDWTAVSGNPWSNEAEIEVVTAAGSTDIDPPTSGGAGNGNPATLTFSGDFAGFYEPDVDGTFDIIMDQSFGGSSAEWSNVTVTLFEAPSCFVPENLVVSNITASSVQLDWDPSSTETDGYDYVLISDGSTPDATTTPTGSVAPGLTTANATGLTDATTYDAYVRTNCGAVDGLSDWSAVASFTTNCLTFVAPYTENFDNNGNEIPNCWSQSSTDGEWQVDTSPTFGNTYTDNTSGSGSFAFVDASNFNGAASDITLTSPLFDVSGLTVPALQFFVHHFKSQNDTDNTITVEVWDGAAWNQVYFDDTADVDGWEEVNIDLSPFTITGDVQVRFIVDNTPNNFYNDIAIDDFSVLEFPTCFKPTNLLASNITLTSADVSWDPETTATNGYIWSLFTAGSDPLVDTPLNDGTTASGTTSVNLTGLTESTDYVFYVESDCGVEGTSGLSTSLPFSTITPGLDCGFALEATVTPYGDNSQPIDFDTTDLPDMSSVPSCEGTDSTEQGYWYEFTTNSTGGVVLDLISGDPGDLEGAIYDACGGTELFCFADGSSVDLSSEVLVTGLDQNTSYILQVFTESFNEGVFSLAVTDLPPCPQLQNLNASAVTSDSAQLNWNAEPNASNGYSWEVYTSPSDVTTDTPVASGTLAAGTNSASVTGLLPETDYDFYVIADCDADGFSDQAGPATFTTLCAPFVPDYLEDFTSYLPNCWQEAGEGDPTTGPSDFGNSLWIHDQFLNATGSNNSVNINLYTDNREDWLISPIFDLSGGDYELKYIAAVTDFANGDAPEGNGMGSDDEVQVLITEDNGLTWTSLRTYNQSDFPSETGDLETIDLSAYSGNVRFAFWGTDGSVDDPEDYDFFIDEFEVRTPPPPANDNVCDAIPLTVGAPSSGDAYTNELATAETNEPVPACFNGGINGSVWFTFVAPDSGEVFVTTDIEGATLTDTEVAVYDAPTDCADLTTFGAELGCNQDIGFPNFQSQVDLTGLTPGETYYIQVDQWGTATPGTFGIRVLDANPSCPVPANLSVSNIGESSATLNWDDVAEAANGYEWFVYTSPSDITTDTPVASGTVGAGVLTDDVTGLMPQTDYDFYVSSDCDVDDTSILSDPVTFTTDCSAFTPDYLEDFTNFVPDCWNEATDGDPTTGPTGFGSGDWAADGFLNNGSSGSARINLYNTGTSDWLLSPRFDLSAGGYELIFDVGITAFSGNGNSAMGSDDEVQLLYSDDNGATWNNLITWNAGNEPSNSGELAEVDLSAITGANVQFAFWATEGAVDDPEDYNIYVDNFEVRTPPTCPEPENLTVSNITLDSADLSWDEVVEASTGYNWSVYTSPSDPSTDTPVADGTVGTGVTTTQVTGLMPNSEYDFYLEADCGSTDGTSVLVGPVTFSTIPDFCGGDLFYDNGGPGADYANNSNETITISPSSASDVVTVSFTSFSTEFNYDGLLIYDGPDTSAPLIDSGYEAPGFSPLSDGAWTGDSTEGSIPEGLSFISTHPSGSLTFVFTSDVSFTEAGWEATVTCGPPPTPASVQIIHNSADPAAEFVDVYVNGVLTLDDFEFRTATPFVDLPADTFLNIDVAPSTSTDVSESIYNLNTTLTADETYIVVANGVLDPTQFDASANTIDFGLDVFAGAQQSSTVAGDTSLLVHHGSTDAPTIDAVETSVPVGTIVDDLAYSEFQGYLDVLTQDYVINIETADNSAVVESYEVPLQTLGLSDQAISVVASGFLDPVANQNGPAFGLWVALPAGGPLVELPVVTPEPMTPAPDPTEDPLNVISMFSGVYTDVPVDTWLTPWSSAQLADIQIQGNDTKLYTDLDFAGIETVANPIDASGMDFFHIDVWSPNATTFRVKLVDLGAGVEGEIAFDIAQEQWVSLEIPLNDFADPTIVTDPNNLLTSRSSLQQLIISGLPAGAVTAYVDNVYFSDDPSISTTNFDRNNFNFYPNPTRNLLNLETSSQVENVRIYNMLGQQVMEDTPNSVSPSLNVDSLQSGTYIMNVTIDGVSKNFKFVKE